MIDLEKLEVTKEIAVGPTPHNSAFSPDGRYVLATGIAGSVVNVIDARSFERIKQIEVGQGPHGGRSGPDGR